VFLLFSSLGNWGYTYRAHQKFGKPPRKEAFDILDARYAKGEINRDEYNQMKSEIAKE
jgi:putative membrane protein